MPVASIATEMKKVMRDFYKKQNDRLFLGFEETAVFELENSQPMPTTICSLGNVFYRVGQELMTG
jgi:hypothetical protein